MAGQCYISSVLNPSFFLIQCFQTRYTRKYFFYDRLAEFDLQIKDTTYHHSFYLHRCTSPLFFMGFVLSTK